MNRGVTLALAFAALASGCADEVSGPPCTFTPLRRSITYTGPVSCTLREEGIPLPWLDLAGCEISVLLPTGHACDEVGGREVAGDGGRVRCVLERLVVEDRTLGAPPPSGMGWFWDDFTTDMPCPTEPSPNTIRIEPTPLVGTTRDYLPTPGASWPDCSTYSA